MVLHTVHCVYTYVEQRDLLTTSVTEDERVEHPHVSSLQLSDSTEVLRGKQDFLLRKFFRCCCSNFGLYFMTNASFVIGLKSKCK